MRWASLFLVLSLMFSVSACKKKKKDLKEPTATQTKIQSEESTNTTSTANTSNAISNSPDNSSTNITDSNTNISSRFGPIYFEYDASNLSEQSKNILDQLAEYLEAHPSATVLISGHADERGTEEYNLSLGEDRAKVAKDYLLRWKIPSSRIKTISYGEERPAVQGEEESSWAQNRRDEFEISP